MLEDDKIAFILMRLGHLAAERDREVYVRELAELCRQATDAERSTIFLVDHNRKQIWAKVAQRLTIDLRMPLGEGLAGQSAATGETINVPDAYADQRFNTMVDLRTGFHTSNALVVPVWGTNGSVTAVLEVLNKNGGVFERRDQMLLERIAEGVASTLGQIQAAEVGS